MRTDTASLLTVGVPSFSTFARGIVVISAEVASDFGKRLRGEFERFCRTALHRPAALSISAGAYYSPSQPFWRMNSLPGSSRPGLAVVYTPLIAPVKAGGSVKSPLPDNLQ